MSKPLELKKSFWSLPQDSFVEGLRDPQSRAIQLWRLKRQRWWILGGLLLWLGSMVYQLLSSEWVEGKYPNLITLIIGVVFAVSVQENRCQQYIIELAELLSTDKEKNDSHIVNS